MNMSHEKKLAAARAHMTAVACGLRHVIGPVHAAGIFFAGGIELFGSAGGGRPAAIQYLRELADELEKDQTPTEDTVQ